MVFFGVLFKLFSIDDISAARWVERGGLLGILVVRVVVGGVRVFGGCCCF